MDIVLFYLRGEEQFEGVILCHVVEKEKGKKSLSINAKSENARTVIRRSSMRIYRDWQRVPISF
jgi:hypothetical protein